MNELEKFLECNDIDKATLMDALFLDIRELVLKDIIERMKADNNFLIKIKRYYFKHPDDIATRKILKIMYGLTMSDKDIAWFNRCIRAFCKKKSTRATISLEIKRQLLDHQNHKCALCGNDITLLNMHVDHIIPWDYVGDELEDNLQGLCSDCNQHKSNHVAIAISSIVLGRRAE